MSRLAARWQCLKGNRGVRRELRGRIITGLRCEVEGGVAFFVRQVDVDGRLFD